MNRSKLLKSLLTSAVALCCVSLVEAGGLIVLGNQIPGTNIYPGGGLTRAASLTLPAGWNQGIYLDIDPAEEFAYIAGDTSPIGSVYKVNLASMQAVSSLTLGAGENKAHVIFVDPNRQYAYVGTYTSPGRVVRIDLSNFSRKDSLTMATGTGIHSGAISPFGEFVYFTDYDGSPGVFKLECITFSIDDTSAISPTTFLDEAAITPDGNTLLVTGNGSSDQLANVDQTTFSLAESIDLGSSNTVNRSIACDPTSTFAYVGSSAAASRILKVDLVAGSVVGTATLLSGETEPAVLVPSLDGNHVFAALSTDPGVVLRIDANTMTRTGGITMPGGEKNFRCGRLIEGGDFLALLGYGFPSTVVKVATSQYGLIKGTKVSLLETATLQAVGFYSHEAGANVRLAVYDNSSPRMLLWESGEVATVQDGFIEAPVSPTMELPSGDYWLCWQSDTRVDVPSFVSGGASNSGFVAIHDFGAFPADISTTTTLTNSENWSIYAELQAVSRVDQWRMIQH